MKLSYQKLEFAGMVYVPGFDRFSEYQRVFPEPPVGKTILDVGCHNGFYILQACYDGAAKGFGVEKNPGWAEKAREVAKLVGIPNVVICNNDIEKIDLTGTFDVVLCLNLLHHFRAIVQVRALMDRLDAVCGDRMVFVVLDPSDSEVLWSREVSPRGQLKMRISWRFFQDHWPAYQITWQPTTVSPPGRSIVEVKKTGGHYGHGV